MFQSLTGKQIGGKVGSETLRLKPGGRAVVKRPVAGKNAHSVDLFYKVPGDDFVYPLCKTQWRNDPRNRKLAFVFDQGDRRAPRVRAFTDFRMPRRDDG